MGQAEVDRPLEDESIVMESDFLNRRGANGIQQLVRIVDSSPGGRIRYSDSALADAGRAKIAAVAIVAITLMGAVDVSIDGFLLNMIWSFVLLFVRALARGNDADRATIIADH